MKDHYILENRGYGWIYHWIIYMLGGLRHVNSRYIYFDLSGRDQGYHFESLKLIEDDYINYVPDESSNQIHHHGEPLIRADHVHPDTYRFLRTLFLSKVPKQDIIPGNRYYITRNNCHIRNPANAGKMVRTVLNEHEIYDDLKQMGFTILQFEDYSFEEKIRIFNTAEIIVSPNSGSLTFSLFASPNTKIIEILPQEIRDHDHYKNICEHLGIPYYRYNDIKTIGDRPALGSTWNIYIDKNAILKYINTLIS